MIASSSRIAGSSARMTTKYLFIQLQIHSCCLVLMDSGLCFCVCFSQLMEAGATGRNGLSAASRAPEGSNREVGLAPIPRRPTVETIVQALPKKRSRVMWKNVQVKTMFIFRWLPSFLSSDQLLVRLFVCGSTIFSRRWLEWVWGMGRVQQAVWWRRTIEKSDLHQSPAGPWWRTVLWGRQGDASVQHTQLFRWVL